MFINIFFTGYDRVVHNLFVNAEGTMSVSIEPHVMHFLHNLKQNNDRDWFHTQKKAYQQARTNVIAFVSALIEKLSNIDESIDVINAESCLFRINRDIRFSKNKEPYKTNFGAFINPGGKKAPTAGYYLHIEPGESFIGGGAYQMPPEKLLLLRKAIIERNNEYKKIIGTNTFKNHFATPGLDPVKTAPRGFDKKHPDIDLIRYRHYVVMKKFSDSQILEAGFMKECMNTFKAMKPFNGFINSVLMK